MSSSTRTPASLRRRLLLQVVLPLLALFALDGALSAWAAHYYANRVYDRWLSDSAQSLAQQVRLTGGQAALNLPRAAQEMFEWDAEDAIVFRVEGSTSGLIAGREVPLAGRNEQRLYNVRFYEAPIEGHDMRWVRLTSPLPPMGEEVTVTVGETMRKRDRLADEILLWVWVPQIVLLLVAGYIAYRAIVVQTDKLHALSVSLRDMSYRNLSAVPGENMPAEMQPLLEALNALIGKLDAAALAHRTFIANAAHQLRTPLTTLSLQAEQALHCSRIEDMRDAVGGVQAAVQRATRLANQLLLLSRAEPEAQSGATRRRTDLYELAFETASAWVPAAMAAGIDLGFDETSAHVTAEVDAALVAEAINNLLDNALKYCPPQTRVTVAVRVLPEPAIVVEDTGPGIAPAERSRVVQRFYRGDHATRAPQGRPKALAPSGGGDAERRFGGDTTEGSGLGLAIANEIALAHSGRFVITDTPGGGARFEIRL